MEYIWSLEEELEDSEDLIFAEDLENVRLVRADVPRGWILLGLAGAMVRADGRVARDGALARRTS